jgi:hypothetical protein
MGSCSFAFSKLSVPTIDGADSAYAGSGAAGVVSAGMGSSSGMVSWCGDSSCGEMIRAEYQQSSEHTAINEQSPLLRGAPRKMRARSAAEVGLFRRVEMNLPQDS